MDLQPPETLHGPTVTLRRYRLDDAPAVREAIAASLGTLRHWVPWAQTPPTDLSVLAFLLPAVEHFGGAAAADYAIILRDAEQYVGGCGMMPRIGPAAVARARALHDRSAFASTGSRPTMRQHPARLAGR